jgi:hypothetical protein
MRSGGTSGTGPAFLAGGRFQSASIKTTTHTVISFCSPNLSQAAKSQLEKPEMVMIYLVA